VFTTCFQRDSAKDQAVVFVFIGATVGLLGWAALRPWVEGWREVCISEEIWDCGMGVLTVHRV
jgi:hypothetical protein